MSLDVKFLAGVQSVKTGTGFTAGLTSDHANGTALGHTVYLHDLLMPLWLSSKFYVPSFGRSVASSIGLDLGLSARLETFKVSSPVDTFIRSDGYDAETYGSIFSNLPAFGQFLEGKGLFAPSPLGEKSCRHRNFSGELIVKQSDVPTATVDYDLYGYSVKVRTTNVHVFDSVRVDAVDPVSLTVYSSTAYDHYINLNVLDVLTFLLGKEIVNIALVEGKIQRRVISDVSFTLTFERLIVQYHCHSAPLDGTEYYDWDSKLVVPFVDPPATIVPSVGLTRRTDAYTGLCEYSYSIRSFSTPYTGDSLGPLHDEFTFHDYASFYVFLSLPLPSDSVEDFRLIESTSALRSGRFVDKFNDDVLRAWSDFTPAATFSTVDAFKKAEGYLGTNVLQNLAKLPNIVAALPKIREAVDILGHIAKRDLSLSTLKEILDLATSTHLQANFEWRPYLSIVTTYLPQMISTFQSLGIPTGTVTSHGSFRFHLFNEVGRQEITLLARTKIVMDASPSGLVSAALGIDALGLLPKASNLWDLIPFTFVVNWFTGIGESIRRAEFLAFLSTIPAYFVHSYTLSSPLSADELDLLGASSSSSEPASLKLYYRDVSLFSPPIRDSRFGFGLPTGLPPVGLLGSLLYQLIFG